MNSLFCRHNRFRADCPICVKGTPLDTEPRERSQTPKRSRTQTSPKAKASQPARYPFVSVGPYVTEDEPYEVRLERVPGGVRVGEWVAGTLRQRAPRLAADDLAALLRSAIEAQILDPADSRRLSDALQPSAEASHAPTEDEFGRSPGRAGEMREELRIEPGETSPDMVRIARWMYKPGTGWQLHDAPTLFAPRRYAEAIASALRCGVIRCA